LPPRRSSSQSSSLTGPPSTPLFIFDDTAAVLRNATIKKFWSLGALNPPADGGTTTGRPLVNLSFALNHAVSGENPWSYHALNLALHVACALVLIGLLRRTVGRVCDPPSPTPRVRGQVKDLPYFLAFLVALLWSLHPLLTETVACTAQRTESLCALFYLLTLFAFARAVGASLDCARPVARPLSHVFWFSLSVLSCLAGMASKEVMVSAPLAVLLYDRTFVAGTFAGGLRSRRGYYATLAATWLLLAWLVLRNDGARGVAAGFGLGVSPWHYLLTQADALALYQRLTFWPHPLILDYGTPLARSLADVWWQSLLIVALLAATLAAIFTRRLRPFGFLAALFFLLLAPSSSFVPLITQTIAEHRMYLPLAAVLVVAALALHRLTGRRALPALASLALVGAGLTFARAQLYRTPAALWQHDVATRTHARSITALGVALLHAGRPAEALPHFDRELALDPAHLVASRNRALSLLHLGRAAEAATILAALPAREEREADEFFALGNAFAREQKFAQAAAAYARTVALAPDRLAARANLGNTLLLSGRPAEAIAQCEEVLRRQPGDARAQENVQLAREALRQTSNR
jgi:Tfp pilus assembly protein PilF